MSSSLDSPLLLCFSHFAAVSSPSCFFVIKQFEGNGLIECLKNKFKVFITRSFVHL